MIFGATGLLLFVLGLLGTFLLPDLNRKVITLNVMASGVFLVFAATAVGDGEGPPDPVPQAIVLTGIVVAMASSAFALSLARQVAHRTGAWVLPEDEG